MIDTPLMNEIKEAAAQGKTSLIEEVCKRCGGDGWMKENGKPFNNCPICNGTGKEKEK